MPKILIGALLSILAFQEILRSAGKEASTAVGLTISFCGVIIWGGLGLIIWGIRQRKLDAVIVRQANLLFNEDGRVDLKLLSSELKLKKVRIARVLLRAKRSGSLPLKAEIVGSGE